MLTFESAHGGSYSIYYALAVASKEIQVDHRYVLPVVLCSLSGVCAGSMIFKHTESHGKGQIMKQCLTDS
jgi:hypothetical protein